MWLILPVSLATISVIIERIVWWSSTMLMTGMGGLIFKIATMRVGL